MTRKRAFRWLVVAATLAVAALGWGIFAQAGTKGGGPEIRGGGTTIVEGGTGEPSFTPVITKFAFHWRGGEGALECLALAPSEPAGSPGSGEFDTNVMYVTGKITSATIRSGQTAILRGTATVTGVGAGSNRPFTATVTRGGAGATFLLEVSGLTFNEIVLEGEIEF